MYGVMGFLNRKNNGKANLHRWDVGKGENICLRCGCIRRIPLGTVYTERAITTSSVVYEFSTDRINWTQQIPNCK